MNELTTIHEIAIFTMCLAWIIYIFLNVRKNDNRRALCRTFWSFVLLVTIIGVMAFASSTNLVLGVLAGVIANELSHKIRSTITTQKFEGE